MTYLLDTNVISALRVLGRNPAVEAWVRSVPVTDLYTTAFTIAEIERGIAKKERSDPDQGAVLRRWFDNHVLPAFSDRVLGFDLAASRVLGRFVGLEHAPYDDALIASVAAAHGLIVVTRNTKHFVTLSVPTLDPWR
ncbi:MAG: type II toxin-antitoxin system VapC family toxin [Micrococcales bacterium]|nr:type II toxin-antitoxin system VapC family toxin [Micrococcales bacterium]